MSLGSQNLFLIILLKSDAGAVLFHGLKEVSSSLSGDEK
jgi:hypothetical protein